MSEIFHACMDYLYVISYVSVHVCPIVAGVASSFAHQYLIYGYGIVILHLDVPIHELRTIMANHVVGPFAAGPHKTVGCCETVVGHCPPSNRR